MRHSRSSANSEFSPASRRAKDRTLADKSHHADKKSFRRAVAMEQVNPVVIGVTGLPVEIKFRICWFVGL